MSRYRSTAAVGDEPVGIWAASLPAAYRSEKIYSNCFLGTSYMLPSSVFDWWFAPWTYAVNQDLHLPLAQDRFARRDGYRMWCTQAQVDPDFPSHFHAAWHIAITSDPAHLISTAKLFGGLFAAREHDQTLLGSLSTGDRKWCLGIAATQPLQRCHTVQYEEADAIEIHGLVEIARRLQSGFPGLWSRLRLMLTADFVSRVDELVKQAVRAPVESDAAHLRAQRCWRMCKSRAESVEMIDHVSDPLALRVTPKRPMYSQRMTAASIMED